MPKSRVRSKAVYTPPPRTSKAKVSPPWLVPTMLGSLIVGLVSRRFLVIDDHMIWNYRTQLEDIAAARARS